MYPDKYQPSLGTFVRDSESFFGSVTVAYPGNKARSSRLRFYASAYLRALRKLTRHDRLIVHYPLFFLPIVAAARVVRRRITLVYHGGEIMPRPGLGRFADFLRLAIFDLNNRMANEILVPSQFVADRYFQKFSDKSRVWYSGGIVAADRVESYENRTVDLGFVGRNEVVKGQGALLAALDSIDATDVTAHIINRDEPAATVRRFGSVQVRVEPGLSHREVLDTVGTFRFLVVPSYEESLCLVALEAATRGTVVIARSSLGSVRETLGDAALYFDSDTSLAGVLQQALQSSSEEWSERSSRLRNAVNRFERARLLEDFRAIR